MTIHMVWGGEKQYNSRVVELNLVREEKARSRVRDSTIEWIDKGIECLGQFNTFVVYTRSDFPEQEAVTKIRNVVEGILSALIRSIDTAQGRRHLKPMKNTYIGILVKIQQHEDFPSTCTKLAVHAMNRLEKL